MKNEFLRIIKRSILLTGLLVIGASCSAFAQNKTVGFKPGAVYSQGRVVGASRIVRDVTERYRDATALYSTDALEHIRGMGYRIAGFSLNADFGASLPAGEVKQ